MSSYFLDSSAIVKRYVSEVGHGWITSLCDPAQHHDLFIAQVALAEVVATLCRKAREAAISVSDRDTLIDTFRQDSLNTYVILPITSETYTYAGDLCRTHTLRAYDAVQLASALTLRDEAAANNAPAPVFLCADRTLSLIATSEGLSVENPNAHP
ncbi:MAG TPA: type II toxin-antitoxin system VapC family toxin [Ktedonobacterales bacterium]|nr:type II toxin-antitoxin system VapC family toxin [Ktedonobacterales bacterium]